jgi:hypothetical protein
MIQLKLSNKKPARNCGYLFTLNLNNCSTLFFGRRENSHYKKAGLYGLTTIGKKIHLANENV